MKTKFKIGDVLVELYPAGTKVIGYTKAACEKVADYLFTEGFVQPNQPIQINIQKKFL